MTPKPPPTLEQMQKRIDGLEARIRHFTRKMVVVVLTIGLGFGLTGWQIAEAFNSVEKERLSRIGGQSSINAYFCRKIDEVGDGVAVLVAASLKDAPPRSSLTEDQREGFDRFTEYLDRQHRPPRCRQVALQLAILTGADPDDVVITPLRLKPPDRAR